MTHRPHHPLRGASTRLVAGLACLALLAAACGSDDTYDEDREERTGTPPTTAPATTEEAADPEPDPDAVAWEEVAVEGESPPARSAAVLVAAPDGSVWLHGGEADLTPLGDLWRFDGERWEQIETEGPAPAPRFEHQGMWDEARERLIVTTGEGAASEVFGDTWAFDPEAGSWELLAEDGPAPRYGACSVVDEQGRMILTHGFSLDERFGDTWRFDPATATWTGITPDGDRPVNRCLHACTWDAASDELVLFGGRSDDVRFLGDTWRLGADGWREVATDGPTPRVHATAVLVGGDVELLGGLGEAGLTADLWRLAADTWEQQTAAPTANRHSAASAQHGEVLWLFGGMGPDGELGDLWRLG